ncbi:MAG: type III polyketide synthase [Bacteroidota bacterium]
MAAFIQSISTTLPPYSTKQNQIANFMVRNLNLDRNEERKLRVLYRASGIGQRYSVLQDFSKNLNGKSFFKKKAFPSAKPRMTLYQQHAIKLAKDACSQALWEASSNPHEITHLIAVSCTGMYAPGLDIELIESLGLKTNIQRISINFMGCYAAFNALKTASTIASANNEANILIVCVELCSIHLQDKKDDENFLANAIFGDGAAALVVNSRKGKKALELSSFYSDLALAGKDEMGWYIGDYGFEMRLSAKVPGVIRDGIRELTLRLLQKIDLDISDIDFFAIHPGGKRILEVIEDELHLTKDQNAPAWNILKTYGNMSSPTVLFVIKQIFDGLKQEDDQKHILSFAFGPGLTLESAIIKVHIDA